MISGGGMIYELFAGERFAARYNDQVGTLKINDIANSDACEYGADGMLVMPEKATPGYAQYCQHLSTNTLQVIEK
ncbi:MAG: hypothetical protein FD130_1417 [Halothiobacillaceae bacterium]|nr:MAG: hypothetical protein FD130_1417 [Halothiobacillaceae bacterium]